MELHSSSSFEEGEAFPTTFNGGDDDDVVVDPDIALSYIDEKIQNLLGHCRRDFEGGVSAENLGAKFGGYGSFLPTYQRSPPRPQTKTPQINYKVSRSPVNLLVEAPAKNFTAPSKTPPLGRPSAASCNTKSLNITSLPSPDGVINQDSCLLSVQAAEKSPLKNETVNKSVVQNRQRQPKIRIKMGTDNFVRNNVAAVYTDLGLDDSPSSSGGDIPDICGTVPSNESPTNILQEMTSFPVVGGLFLSPLHDDLLCLSKKDIHLSRLDSKMTVSNVLKEKKTGIVAKVQRQKKNANDTDAMNASKHLSTENLRTTTSEGKNSVSKKLKLAQPTNISCGIGVSTDGTENLRTTTSEGKNSVSKKLKLAQPTNISCGIGVSTDGTVRADANKDRLKGSPSSFHLAKGEPMDFYGMGNIERDGANNTSDIQNEHGCKSNKTSAPLSFNIPKDKKALHTGVNEPSKQELRLVENKGINLSSRVGKDLIRKKTKLNHVQNKDMQDDIVVEKSTSLELNMLSEDKCCIQNKPKSKRLRLKKQYNEDFTEDLKSRQIENMEKPLGLMTKSSNPDYSEKEYDTFNDKSMENLTCGGKVENKYMFEVSLNQAPSGDVTDNGPISEMEVPLACPLVIQEDWVGCDSCEKWRLLPYGTKKDQLPKKWVCSMLNWLPGMNHCNISEEVTTDALRALYECPVPAIPGDGIKAVDETTLNGSSMNVHNINNYDDQVSQPIGVKENKNYERKEFSSTDTTSGLVRISNSTKNHHRESGKSRNSDGPNQIIEQATGQNESKHNKKSTRDAVNQATIKEKRKADQYNVGGSKRVKTENFGSELNHNSQIDGGINCAEPSTMRSGRSMQKSAGVSSLKNATSLLKDKTYVSVKKEKDESPLSLGGESSYLKVSDNRDDSLKKRNINGQRANRNSVDGNPLPKDVKPKIVASEFTKDKSTCISMGKVNASSSNNEKRRVPPIILSVNRGRRVDGIDKTTNMKNSEGQRCENMVTLGPPTSNRKGCTEYATTRATSSSSKVSGLRISKSRPLEVRDSPVESVSSSPLRTFHREQVAPERWENGKDSDAVNGDIYMTGSDQGRCLDDEGIDKRKQDGPTRKENDIRFLHNENSTLDYREHVNSNLDSKRKPCVDMQNSRPVLGDVDTIGHHVRSSIEHDKGMNIKDGFRSDCDRSKGIHHQLNKLNPSNQNPCNALKEAEDLKSLADTLKGSGFDDERRAAHFQAALKFLLAASLLETNNAEKDGHISLTELYVSTAKHCEMCALEYEGHQEIATAALLYKCMEVAYMRAVYCKHSTTTRDRDELQTALQMPPLGESPSSCLSDVDNVNHQSTASKTTALSKGSVSHSHAAAGQVITSLNRPIINRLLDHTHHVILAMDASTKARNACASASAVLSEKHNKAGIDFLKRVVDFSFHDLEGFVRLVQLAMEAISCSGYDGEDRKKL